MTSLGLQSGTVELRAHDPKWRDLFEDERRLLLDTFGERILAVEHIGSTAICGISAKPIIDMNVAVKSLDNIDDFIKKLSELGYEYMPDRRFVDRQFFPKGLSECRTHHLNLVEITSNTGWISHLLFRDYLRENKNAREEYDTLKRSLAEQFSDDRKVYTEGKDDFITSILDKA